MKRRGLEMVDTFSVIQSASRGERLGLAALRENDLREMFAEECFSCGTSRSTDHDGRCIICGAFV